MPYVTYVFQPPRNQRGYNLTFILRRGDGAILAQQQRGPKGYIIIAQTSIYNVLSTCSRLGRRTYVLTAVRKIIEQRDSQRMTLEEFSEKYDIQLPLPKP